MLHFISRRFLNFTIFGGIAPSLILLGNFNLWTIE